MYLSCGFPWAHANLVWCSALFLARGACCGPPCTKDRQRELSATRSMEHPYAWLDCRRLLSNSGAILHRFERLRSSDKVCQGTLLPLRLISIFKKIDFYT